MKNILIVLVIGLLFMGCGNNNLTDSDKNDPLSQLLDSNNQEKE